MCCYDFDFPNGVEALSNQNAMQPHNVDEAKQALRPVRTCIICGNPAGSGEHLFPAALGGRRTHNGIYCKIHNEGLSPFVAVMADQLALFNGMLEVRHDRKKAPQPPIIASADGSLYSIEGQRFVPQSTRILARTQVGDDREQLVVAVPEHLMGKFKALETNGDIIILAKGHPVPRLQDQNIGFNLSLGGPKFLAAISYVSMTYFAKYHPELAREKTADLESLKASLIDSAARKEDEVVSPEHVWWESTELLETLPTPPFRFSHTIVLSTSQKTMHATAYLSLFGVFCFGIDFGEFKALSDHTVVVHLDPLSPHPPNDQREYVQPGSVLRIAPPKQSQTEHLRNSLSNGIAERQLSTFVASTIDWHLESAAMAMLERLQLIPSGRLMTLASREAAQRLLDDEEQRVFNMMREFVKEFRDKHLREMPDAVGTAYGHALQLQITAQESMPGGLSQLAAASLIVAKSVLTNKILKERDLGNLTVEKAKMLLGGGEGLATVGRSMLSHIMGESLLDE